ncbi:MAG: DUF2892 domain-containing protein [Ignavibacteriae bacterium]|nr:MAG: DUF2892 domain-containing protein [Ignavibacteriota bacterium]
MKQNMGSFDRGARVLGALAIAVLYFTNQISGTTALILGVVTAIFLVTSTMAICPLYLPLKISTRKEAKNA